MQLSVPGSVDASGFTPGWKRETIVSLLGSVKLDLSQSAPAEGASLVVVSVLGGIDVTAPAGRRVTVAGSSVLGKRSTRVEQGEGPAVTLGLWSVLGSVKARSADAPAD